LVTGVQTCALPIWTMPAQPRQVAAHDLSVGARLLSVPEPPPSCSRPSPSALLPTADRIQRTILQAAALTGWLQSSLRWFKSTIIVSRRTASARLTTFDQVRDHMNRLRVRHAKA